MSDERDHIARAAALLDDVEAGRPMGELGSPAAETLARQSARLLVLRDRLRAAHEAAYSKRLRPIAERQAALGELAEAERASINAVMELVG